MLTRGLLFRITWPSILASLLFLTSCTVAAVVLGLRQAATVRALEEDLQGRRIVEELLRDLADLIEIGQLGDAEGGRLDELHADVRRLLAESDAKSTVRPEEIGLVARLESGFRRYWEEVNAEGKPSRDALAILETEVREAARELDEQLAAATTRSLEMMHQTTFRTAWTLAGVGIVATLTGLFFGYSVATGLERAMIRAEELAALGQMAAGMAHELRNPLTAVSMLVQLQREKAEEEGLPVEDFPIIEREITRMEERLNAFMDYARPSRPRRRRIDVAEVAAKTLELVQGRASKHHVEIRLIQPPTPVQLEADGEQIGRVLVNLAMNALDAMPRGGRLTVTIASTPDGFIEIAVDDTGPGVTSKVRLRVFEPFFTSKEAGLGLGLPISERIAHDHGGKLIVADSPGPESGARFILRLPGPSRVAG